MIRVDSTPRDIRVILRIPRSDDADRAGLYEKQRLRHWLMRGSASVSARNRRANRRDRYRAYHVRLARSEECLRLRFPSGIATPPRITRTSFGEPKQEACQERTRTARFAVTARRCWLCRKTTRRGQSPTASRRMKIALRFKRKARNLSLKVLLFVSFVVPSLFLAQTRCEPQRTQRTQSPERPTTQLFLCYFVSLR